MLFYTHKYHDKNKQDFYFHHNILNKLEVLSQSNYFPHFIISGNSGSCKYLGKYRYWNRSRRIH